MRPFFAALALLVMTTSLAAQDDERRWFYASHNLLVDENVEELLSIFERAAAVGYNGVLLADFKFNILGMMREKYFANVERVKRKATELDIEIVPAVFPIGWSSGILYHDPNLAAGIPVKEAPFVARNGAATLDAKPVPFQNGDFEEHDGDTILRWGFQDRSGEITRVDTEVVKSGAASLRMERIGEIDAEHGNGRIQQIVPLTPFRQYHVSLWVKTQDFERADNLRVQLLTGGDRGLNYASLGVEPTQDWTEHHILFNSQTFDQARFYFGVWGGRGGTLWVDDIRVEEIGPARVLRRPGCPIRVEGENGDVYVEGRDFEPIADPDLADNRYHEPPTIILTANTRVKDGERLKVSYYHAMRVHSGQRASSLIEPKVFELMRDQARRVQELFEPRAFFMSHDEIRLAGWDRQEAESGKTPGENLAENARRAIEIIRDANPSARIYVWSDMFDPHHNARDNYYLVNGSFAGSWEGLTSDVIIANWYFGKRNENMPFFAERGHKQLLAGYYDGDPTRIARWLEDARGSNVPLDGVMYTTWQRRYEDLEAFATAAWGASELR